jgi:hypothetical protein
MITRSAIRAALLLLLASATGAYAQADEGELRFFGYFQNIWVYQEVETGHNQDQEVETGYNQDQKIDSFSVQQLNLFMQRDLARRWTAFVNFEMLNSYSSFRNWGAFTSRRPGSNIASVAG